MSALQQIFIYLFGLFGTLYATICLLRVLLQLSRADYYNPLSQFVIKATKLPVKLLRTAIPSWRNLDLAGLVWCLLFQLIAIELAALIIFQTAVSPLTALAWGATGLLSLLVYIFYFGMIILIIVSFATLLGGMHIQHPALNLLHQIMAPVLKPLQRLIPPISGLDLSPLLLFVMLQIFRILITSLAASTGLHGIFKVLVPGIV